MKIGIIIFFSLILIGCQRNNKTDYKEDIQPESITELDIRSYDKLPDFKNYPNLEKLVLKNIRFDTFPDISMLIRLKELRIESSNYTSLPNFLEQLDSLEKLVLYDNNMNSLPDFISKLERLKNLDASKNNIKEIPIYLGKMRLETLRLSKNNISTIPNEIYDIITLEHLILSGNKIESLSEDIKNLTLLTELDIENNQINILPKNLELLSNLNRLNVRDNKIAKIDFDISKLSSLMVLLLDGNEITKFPNDIFKLKGLFSFGISQNPMQIDSIILKETKEIGEFFISFKQILNDTMIAKNYLTNKSLFLYGNSTWTLEQKNSFRQYLNDNGLNCIVR